MTKFTGRQRAASLERFYHARWITVATLAGGEVIKALFTLATPAAVEILPALTFTLRVARRADRTVAVTVAGYDCDKGLSSVSVTSSCGFLLVPSILLRLNTSYHNQVYGF